MLVGGLRDDLIKSIKNPINFTIELIPQISFELKTVPATALIKFFNFMNNWQSTIPENLCPVPDDVKWKGLMSIKEEFSSLPKGKIRATSATHCNFILPLLAPEKAMKIRDGTTVRPVQVQVIEVVLNILWLTFRSSMRFWSYFNFCIIFFFLVAS